MVFNINKYINYIYIFIVLMVVLFLYNRYEDKLNRSENNENYDEIQKYLLKNSSLANSKKPILWIHIAYEYNSRNWKSFGSRSSFDLNQPYLYLTVKSIINQCKDSFHICIIDDDSFGKLLPTWSIDIKTLSTPSLDYIRSLALSKILHMYGGLIVPPSFLCMRNLIDLYESGINNNKIFICENVNKNITVTNEEFYCDISFMGCQKENPVMIELIDFMQRTISADYTDQTNFLGDFNRWCNSRIQNQQINLIPGKLIGTKTMNDERILVDDLLSTEYIDLYSKTYGIYIPSKDILKRTHYEWFARLSQKQVLESNVIISKYILLANTPSAVKGVIEPVTDNKPNWISYWQIPSGFGLWGMKPLFATHLNKNNIIYKP